MLIRAIRGYYVAYYKKSLKVRRLIRQDYDVAFEKVDGGYPCSIQLTHTPEVLEFALQWVTHTIPIAL